MPPFKRAKTKVYEPQFVALPKEALIHRIFPFKCPNQIDLVDNTIFYDIFYKHGNSSIICIGPPPQFGGSSRAGEDLMQRRAAALQTTEVYEPQSIVLPKESPIHRVFSFKDPNQIDYVDDTIVYDVFYKHDNSSIICICPPLLNLEGVLELKEISCNGKQLRWRRSKLFKDEQGRNLVVIKLPRLLRRELTIQLSFRFNLFEQTVEVSRNHPPARENGESLLTLVTMQRDNPLQWIRDWMRWHSRMHGVGRLILYDNGSREYGHEEIIDILEGEEGDFQENFQTVLVNWDFDYGWHHNNCHRGLWAQLAALNHCYLKYGDCGWLLNLDIDEYLVAEDETRLRDYLRQTCQHYLPFRQRQMQNIGPEKPLPERSFRDFLWYKKEAEICLQDFLCQQHLQLWKYVCQCNMPLSVSVHSIFHKSFGRRFQTKIYPIMKRMGLVKLFNNSPREIFRVYHFLLLSTAWKLPIEQDHPAFQDRLRRKLYRDKAYFEAQGMEIIYDDAMIKQAEKHGL